MNRLKGNSSKSMKLIKHFPIEQIAQLMMISCLETSFPAELLTFLKISLKTDGWTCPQKLNFSNQSLAEGDQWDNLDQWDHSNQWEETEQEAWWDLKWVWAWCNLWEWEKTFRTSRKEKASIKSKGLKKRMERKTILHKLSREKSTTV